ncbi:hypothetical protein KSK55_10945 [Methanospirillum purgamenti]|uniref:Uncharacterized protein n=1 Tax=Methanospirillum hungatei TaxID=2203 RepID=A0A8F5VKT6_METHU|nr:hypothetical protein [Methanospirillum hungatei]QXO93861.1 hypothetical protein KSK55_10945 [Methanospirillum hungatei]
MKFGYAIVLALVALVAVSGFASADRLPSQVPENQIFTIDTLIDVTGAVSEESEMQWTLDDQSWKKTTLTQDTTQAGWTPNAWVATALNNAKATDVTVSYNADGTISKLVVSDWMLTKVVNPAQDEDYTYADLIAEIEDESDAYSESTSTDKGYIHNSKLNPTEEIMILTWTDSLRTNGGKLSLNKNIDFDSQNKGKGLSNLEVEKVLTYASTEGAHLVGAEEWTLDVAGNWETSADTIRCVFASSASEYFPAFCNVVKAKSELVNINSAQISTKGAVRSVANEGTIPAMLNYQIAVTPDSNSGSGFADGTVKTMFGGSIMEARDKNDQTSATNNWKDSASVTGGIKNFQKTFNYESGFKF